jgi:hypothetical protein
MMVATLVARNADEAVVMSGRVCIRRESGVRFSVGEFGRNLASVAVKILPYFIYV